MKKIIFLCFTLLALTSCTKNKVYDMYNHTPVAGWEKNDTLKFYVNKMEETGNYTGELGLRINGAYPFTGLTLIVDQTFIPSDETISDTINCNLVDHTNGRPLGQGVSYYQYNYKLSSHFLQRGDSVVVKIRHDMKREILPGISDIGLKVTRN